MDNVAHPDINMQIQSIEIIGFIRFPPKRKIRILIKEFLDALHRGSQIIPSSLRGEG
jgi:hypothetical protein